MGGLLPLLEPPPHGLCDPAGGLSVLGSRLKALRPDIGLTVEPGEGAGHVKDGVHGRAAGHAQVPGRLASFHLGRVESCGCQGLEEGKQVVVVVVVVVVVLGGGRQKNRQIHTAEGG